ncbi:SDR family NAD(P)-dependent oxidoreductase [Paenibacillus sp. GCM10023252]|uniref:SDR family NAD(P)-dependent oxidoreductase n=1 Tax=Paenibacillus sp. GCM10023252 TaxID=3252649 RepID=UPI00360B38A0
MGILAGKVAIITGAGTGLGRAAALSYAREGAQVALIGRRRSKLEETRELMLQETGLDALVLSADVSDEAQLLQAVSTVVDTFGHLDIVVNNAAVFEPGTVAELSLVDWQQQIAVNLTGPFILCKAVLPHMRRARYGRIINITSGLSWNGAGGYAAYSAAKAGLESLTRTLADEEHEHGILVNLYNPGTIRTEMHATGKDPAVVTPDLVRLASLPQSGPTGTIVTYN